MAKSKFSLLGKKEYKLTENLTIHIPLVSEIRNCFEDELLYFQLVSIFTSTPCDAMVELDDCNIDYTKVTEYVFFIMKFLGLVNNPDSVSLIHWHMIFPYIDIHDLSVEQKNDIPVVIDNENNIVIDEKIYLQLADLLRQMLNISKNMEYYKVPEEETRRYIIDRQRLKRKRQFERNKNQGNSMSSSLDGVILLLVNNSNFKYNFKTVEKLTVYDLYACLQQIYTDREIDGIMSGYWSGNIDLKKLDNSKLNRIIL